MRVLKFFVYAYIQIINAQMIWNKIKRGLTSTAQFVYTVSKMTLMYSQHRVKDAFIAKCGPAPAMAPAHTRKNANRVGSSHIIL